MPPSTSYWRRKRFHRFEKTSREEVQWLRTQTKTIWRKNKVQALKESLYLKNNFKVWVKHVNVPKKFKKIKSNVSSQACMFLWIAWHFLKSILMQVKLYVYGDSTTAGKFHKIYLRNIQKLNAADIFKFLQKFLCRFSNSTLNQNFIRVIAYSLHEFSFEPPKMFQLQQCDECVFVGQNVFLGSTTHLPRPECFFESRHFCLVLVVRCYFQMRF